MPVKKIVKWTGITLGCYFVGGLATCFLDGLTDPEPDATQLDEKDIENALKLFAAWPVIIPILANELGKYTAQQFPQWSALRQLKKWVTDHDGDG